jgi:serine/threonine protein kinase
MVVCKCGSEIPVERAGAAMCPACLLRVALEPSVLSDPLSSAPARLLGPVGRGPHGTVHLAVRPDDDPQIVTVKLIEVPTDPQRFSERMRNTADVLNSLRHAAIPEVVQVGVTPGGQAYVVASYVPGSSLCDYVTSHRAGVSERVQLAEQLCSIIADLHHNGVIHGSIKPTNIIVCESANGPFAVLLDTGIVPAIELGAGDTEAPTEARDERSLHALLADLLGDLGGLVEGTESAAGLADMFSRRAG